jgi:hypothetical protein
MLLRETCRRYTAPAGERQSWISPEYSEGTCSYHLSVHESAGMLELEYDS